MTKLCPCGSKSPYSECCEPLHLGHKNATTPQELMRSRYAAFVKVQIDYLIQTSQPQNTEAEIKILTETCAKTDWLQLKILSTPEFSENEGFVEFVAFLRGKNQSRITQHREKSKFHKVDGQWIYIDGEYLPALNIGRNDPCFCDSGHKNKKCHPLS